MGKGIQVLQPTVRELFADIVPVDYLVRAILGSAVYMTSPGFRFILPYNEVLEEGADNDSIIVPNVQYFPYIYQVSASGISDLTWTRAYNSIRSYWMRNSNVGLPLPDDYFAPTRFTFKSKFFSLPQSLSSVASAITNSNNAKSANSDVTRILESASRVSDAMQPFLEHQWVFDHQNVKKLDQDISSDPQFSLTQFKHMDWDTYMVNYAYGVHCYVIPFPPTGLRNISVPTGWTCTLYLHPGAGQHSIIDRQIESIIFSAADIRKRTERMLNELVVSLERPGHELKDKKKMEEWINDFDASLDDWCHDDSQVLRNKDNMMNLGHWADPSESHEEHVRIQVLNDKRVGSSIKQVSKQNRVNACGSLTVCV